MRHRRSACATSRGEAPRAPSAAFCIVQGSVLPFDYAPCVCFNGRDGRGRGRPVSAAKNQRGTAMSLDPSLQYGIREERAIVGDRKGLATNVLLRVARQWRAKRKNRDAVAHDGHQVEVSSPWLRAIMRCAMSERVNMFDALQSHITNSLNRDRGYCILRARGV